jgi:hypothetical protein
MSDNLNKLKLEFEVAKKAYLVALAASTPNAQKTTRRTNDAFESHEVPAYEALKRLLSESFLELSLIQVLDIREKIVNQAKKAHASRVFIFNNISKEIELAFLNDDITSINDINHILSSYYTDIYDLTNSEYV